MEAFRDGVQRIKTVHSYNVQTFRRNPWKEVSGSFGDLGTLLPIMIALALNKSISLPSTLIFGGLANIFTGFVFGIPIPVQPMKAIAAVALQQRFSEGQTMSAGLFVAAVIGFFSFTGLLQWSANRIPISVIKGIQMGTGLSLTIYAGTLLKIPSAWFDDRFWSLIAALFAFLVLLWTPFSKRVPYALLVVLLGIATAIIGTPYRSRTPIFTIWKPFFHVPTPSEFSSGTLQAGIGQVPLTALNSVIAVTFLAADLLPNAKTPSITAMGLSVMAMNLVGAWFGSMPVCHGSGGLAAQYRFGARSGVSIIFLGLLKVILGLFSGGLSPDALSKFSTGLLAVMVIAAGLELASVGESLNSAGARDLTIHLEDNHDTTLAGDSGNDKKMKDVTNEEKKRRWAVMLITVAGILAFRNDAVGFLAGMLCHWSFRLQDRWDIFWSQTGGRIRLEEGSESRGSRTLP